LLWADIGWFEGYNDLIEYGSKTVYAKNKIIICRIHGNEVYNGLNHKPEWANIDQVVFTTPHVKEIFDERIKKVYNGKLQSNLVYHGIDTDLYPFSERKKGFNLGFLGSIDSQANIPLTLQIFKTLFYKDQRYKLYLAGVFPDRTLLDYIEYFIDENNLKGNIFIEDLKDLDKDLNRRIEFYNRIDYFVVSNTSIDERLCYTVTEAMSCGVKPVLANGQGVKYLYKKEYIFSGFYDALRMIEEDAYNSLEYRLFITDKYSFAEQNQKIKVLLNELIEEKNREREIETNFRYNYETGYYLRENEIIQPYMEPWELMLNYSLPKNIILGQIQNQFKYILEKYLNGSNNLLDYRKYLTYLYNLLKLVDIDSQKISSIDKLYKYGNGNINKIEDLERLIVILYPILSDLFRQTHSNARKKVIITSEWDCIKADINNRYIFCLFSKLYESLAPISTYIKSFLVHGSLSTLDYTNYSDVDTFLILNEKVFSDVNTMQYIRKVVKDGLSIIYEFDPLQHHGFFVATEMDLDYYPEAYLPLKSLEYGTLLIGDKELQISIRSSQLENRYSLWVLAYGFREMFITKKYPDNLFSLKRYTSRLMLLPSLYLETFFEQYLYKRESFSAARKYFSEHAWHAIEIATELREKWVAKGRLKVNKDFYLATLLLAEECLAKLSSMEANHEL